MDRKLRRALERRHHRELRRNAPAKRTHSLGPEVNVLYVPDHGYVAGLIPGTYRIVKDMEHATPYLGDEASDVALMFRESTGHHVTIRPYYCPHAHG